MISAVEEERPMAENLTWKPPGPGYWEWQGSHLPGIPTPIYRQIWADGLTVGVGRCFERIGVPLAGLEPQFVHDRAYTSLRPLVGKRGAAPPPKPLMWLALRVHPAFRRRAKTAAHTLAQRTWRARTVEWTSVLRPRQRAANLALQQVELEALDAASLVEHLRRASHNALEGHVLHFDLHGDDLGPLGLYLVSCQDWGIAPGDAIGALAGHSPSTAAPVEALREVGLALLEAGWTPARPAPASLEELRAISGNVSAALDGYLQEFGWRMVTGYDLDGRTVVELPEALLANVLASTEPFDATAAAAAGDAAAVMLRARVPAAERPTFDEALDEARVALDLRDDNGPMTVEWTMGLLRRALLEAGRRLAERGALATSEDAVELTLAEVEQMLLTGTGPSADEVSARGAARRAARAAPPPPSLGEREPDPDLSVFPAPLAKMTRTAMTAVSLLEREQVAPSTAAGVLVSGLGVGAEAYVGRARVAQRAEDALAAIEPGDVLVVPFTTPAYNAVLAVCGAVVTEEGGVLAHAAVLARELGLPAVVGAAGALGLIRDGADVEVDPVAGTVRLLSA
jgi:phosphohistidine swiveling domain-containing protein